MQKYNLLSKHLNFNLENFILKHLNDNINTLALKLKANTETDFNTNLVLETLNNFKKAKYKLPTLASNYCWLPTKSYEQASSEMTAFYKSRLYKGNNLLDLCGGLGIDDIAFSKVFDNVITLDADNELNEIAYYNFKKLALLNIERITMFAEDFLAKNSEKFDLIYIDADRRPETNAKKFILSDCTPNILEIYPQIKKSSNQLLIKLSPLVDLDYCKSSVENINEIHVVAVKNEVKEVLLMVDFTKKIEPIIKAINIIDETNIQSYQSSKITNSNLEEKTDFTYFYEPNASIIKAKLSLNYAKSLGLKMIASNSNFFIGNELISDFMGRSFVIIKSNSFSKSSLNNYLKTAKIIKANISKRNFPINEAEIAKLFKIKDGGDDYLFFTQNNQSEKLFFHCRKLIH